MDNNAKQGGELHVESGKNQGIWITVLIPKEALSGRYTGEFTLEINNAKLTIPVVMNVYDAELSDKSTLQSIFLMRSDYIFSYGQLDGSVEMMRKYYDALLEYRMNAYVIPITTDDAEEYVEAVKEYFDNPKVTNYGLPNSTKGNGGVTYNHKVREYILALAKASKQGKNYLSKLLLKCCDESDYTGTVATDAEVIKKLRLEIINTADIIGYNENGVYDGYLSNFERKEDAVDFIENIGIVDPLTKAETYITANYDDALDPQTDEGKLLSEANVWCPQIGVLETEYRDKLYECAEKYNATLWAYTANGPRWPYPTYHLGANPISVNILSWMYRDYKVKGNLYWAVTYYAGDAWTDPTRWGDGGLFYPGAKYGIDGPLPSIRIMRARDGIEEYELLGKLESKYSVYAAENDIEDYDEKSVFDCLYGRLFSGMEVYDDSSVYREVRDELREYLAEDLTQSGFFVSGINNGKLSSTVTFYAKKGANVDGRNIIKVSDNGALSKYSYTTENRDGLSFLNVNVNNTDYKRFISGNYKNIYDGIKKDTESSDYKTSENSAISKNEDGLKLSIASKFSGDTAEDRIFTPYVTLFSSMFDLNCFVNNNGKDRLVIKVYNPNETQTISVYFMINNTKKYYTSITLAKQRYTDIEIRLNGIDADIIPKITGLRFETKNIQESSGNAKITEVVVKDMYFAY